MQKKLHIYLLLAFAFWLLPFSAYTQTYPVTISTQLTQPSPIYLSNYANTTSINSPIKVQLMLNDLTIMNRQVRLKCYFQGAVSFVTNDFVVGASPIYLDGGFPTLLTNVELAPYFEFQNLQGITPDQYAQPLPEGMYTISFEVYDFVTNKKLSKKSSVTTVIFQNEPPLLNLPANKAGVVEQNIQNIIFSWTPRSINVSNAEYEFSLVEIWNTNTPIQNAFAYSPPLFTTTTRNTTVQYSLAEPQLIPGRTYAWRVKAKALVGAEEIGVFKNNGYSEIFSFKYLTLCNAPIAITTTNVSQDQAKVTWSGAVDNFDYQINYREKNANSKWYPLVTPREYATISNLKPKTTYEYTVGAACDPNEYTHSSIQEFTTIAQDEIAFTGCGIKPAPSDLANKTPLPDLFPNDVVTAGDFPIVVLKSTGSNGTFSGEGYVTLPFLEKFKELIDAAAAAAGSDENGDSKANIGKYSRIRITFNNIGVNTDFKLISGEIVASYDPKWGSMVDGDQIVNDLMGDTGTVIPLDIQFEIKSVVKNADGSLTITGTNGVVVQQPKTANDLIITDREGKQYAVSPNAPAGDIKQTGKAAPGGVPSPQNTNGMGSGGTITQISSPDVNITFTAGTGFYSLDENPNQDAKLKDNTKLNKTYDIIPKKDGTNYYVNYKVISDAPNAEDYVIAKATFSNGKTTADIVFKTENGTEIPSTWSGNVATLKLKRTLDFSKESILATVKPPVQKEAADPKNPVVAGKYDIAGTLNMWHMTSKKVNVTLVGLNGGKTPTQSQAKEYLNSIYGKAGIQFEVNTITADITDSWGASIETGDSDLLNTYTDGQLKINSDFQAQLGANYKNDTYYVFFTKAPSSKPATLGFMPLKRQFGYVFAPPSETGGLRTLAHELGHGIFGLQHPFTNYNTTVVSDLLMDYGTGTALSHNDWEIMHAPGLQLYQFTQGSSAGEQIEVGNMEQLYANFKNKDGSLTFLSPAGIPITIKESISSVGFSYFDDDWSSDKASFENTVFPIGTLKKFTLTNGKTYSVAHPIKDDKIINIAGYSEVDKNGQVIENTLYVDKTTFGLENKNIIVGIPAIEKGQLIFKVQKIEYKKITIPKENYGKGPQEDVYFLKSYITSAKVGINIASSISPLDINELYFISEFSSDLYGMNALHAIRIAYFLRNNPDLVNCLGYAHNQIGKDVTLRFNKEIRDGIRNEISKNQGTTRVSIPVFYADISNQVEKDVFTSTKYLASLDNLLHIYYTELKNKGNISNDLSLSDLSAVIDGKGRECLLSNISINRRIEFLQQYSTWKISGSKEDMLLELLINIRPDDIPELLNGLSKDNYELLRGLYNDMTDKEDYYTLLSVISTYVADQKKNTAEAKNLQGTWKAGGEKYVYVCKDALHILTCGVEITEFNNANGKVTIKFQDFSNTFNDKPVFKTISVDPFDLLRIKFENDFDIKNTNGHDIKKGQEAVVPAIYLYWIMKQQQDTTSEILLRIALDGLAIIPAYYTANPELVVLVDAAVAGTDIAFQLSSDAIKSSDSALLNNLVEGWDEIYKSYSLGRLITSAPAIIKGGKDVGKIIFNREKLNKTITRAKAIPGELSNISKSFYKFYKAIKNSENITIVATKKQILEQTIYGAYVEINLAEKCTTLDEFKLLFQNDQIIVGINAKMPNGASYAQGVSVANVTETNGALILSELRNLPATYKGTTKVVETIKNITVAGKGAQTIEIITTDIGQFYARTKALDATNSFITKINTYSNIVRKYNSFSSELKTTFEADFGTENETSLTKLNENGGELIDIWKKWNSKGIKITDELATISRIEKLNRGTFEAFEVTVGNPATLSQKIKAYQLWGDEKWDDLYAFFHEDPKNLINGGWPPFNGFVKIEKELISSEILSDGGLFDRFQNPKVDKTDGKITEVTELGGSFASPVKQSEYSKIDIPYTYDSRALLEDIQEGMVYIKFRVKNADGLKFSYGDAIPWKNKNGIAQQGLAKQIQSSLKFHDANFIKGITYDIVQRSIFTGSKWVDEIEDLTLKIDKITDKINCK